MADIFISYSNKDEPDARLLSAFLEANGYSVWWDRDLVGGDKYRGAITTELSKARAVVVIWTKNSVVSDWVRSEAGRALREQKLIPVRSVDIEYKDIPPPFDNVQTVTLNDREQILAAVAGQLAKPASRAPLWKQLRFEFQVWLGVLSGAITLVGIAQGILDLSHSFQWLLFNWSALLKYVWRALLFFKFDVSAYDAEMLTIGVLMASTVFYSSLPRPTNRTGKSVILASVTLAVPLFLIFVILNLGLINIGDIQDAKWWREFDSQVEVRFAKNPDCGKFVKNLFRNTENLDLDSLQYRDEFHPQPGREPSLETRDKVDDCFSGMDLEREFLFELRTMRFDKEGLKSSFARLSMPNNRVGIVLIELAVLLSPIFLPFLLYWVVSLVLPLKLQVPVLSRRLWRTLIVFGGIIIINYVAIGMESGINWLKAIPELN